MEDTEIPPVSFKEAVIAENEAEEALDHLVVPADPLAPDDDAPYGYLIDTKSGERRPKKRAGRGGLPGKSAPTALKYGASPAVEDLPRTKNAGEEDRSPDTQRKPAGQRRGKTKKEAAPVPAFRAGPIAAGMNKLYRRVGKIVRSMDYDIGSAIIASTQKVDEDDTTVGEAWEEIARTNPRIRAFLLRMMSGTAWSTLFMAHAPIFLAILMKEGIRKHIPFGKLIGELFDSDEDGPTDLSTALGGIQGADLNEMMAAGMAMMQNMGAAMPQQPRGASGPRPPTVDPRVEDSAA